MSGAPLHVLAGVLRDREGRVLLAERPAGKHLAGLWEFPGGKREPGETPLAALARELDEELGIALLEAEPLIRVPWRYHERELLLDAWCVTRWRGEPRPLEGQGLRWCLPMQADPATLTPADRAILQALRLPRHYLITPAEALPVERGAWFERIGRAIEAGERLLQLRLPHWPREEVREFAASLLPLARHHGAQLLLNADIEGARLLGIGVHLTGAQLATPGTRPLPLQQAVGASCHDAAQLMQALRLEADFATLSPVMATASHPQAQPLGWAGFQALAEAAAMPVYAQGGTAPARLAQARAAGAQGVAGIRGFWPAA
ncbi:Nudix family hydrolase [Rhodanobacter sp. Si-c]|uniref:8-oxo-dGTP diphosphatase n=1 Tax=Rhodanobacter lycopersici TaxID=3162487 RepID=A0ABV3QIW5_9GAMM